MQMEFLWKEMNSTHKSGLNYMKQNGDKSVDSLTEYFCWEFENPGVPHMNERKRYANDIYEKYKNNHNNSNNKCSFNINLYKSNGSVDKSKISQLKTEEDKIINSYRSYKFFNNNGLSYLQCTWWANARASTYLSKFGTKYKSYPTNNGNGEITGKTIKMVDGLNMEIRQEQTHYWDILQEVLWDSGVI